MTAGAGGTLTAVVHGHVQGVGFRWTTRERLAGLGLDGAAENRADGTVVVVARGDTERLGALLRWLRGPGTPGRVERVDVVDGPGSPRDGAPGAYQDGGASPLPG